MSPQTVGGIHKKINGYQHVSPISFQPFKYLQDFAFYFFYMHILK